MSLPSCDRGYKSQILVSPLYSGRTYRGLSMLRRQWSDCARGDARVDTIGLVCRVRPSVVRWYIESKRLW
jgi:hypothetical protein